ncbi:MAG: PKD domain-containing protein, partial [Thermoplasmata archaeon]
TYEGTSTKLSIDRMYLKQVYSPFTKIGETTNNYWVDEDAGYTNQDYYYTVGAVDTGGNLAIDNTEVATKYMITLEDRWNLISLPAEPLDNNFMEVFKSIIDEDNPTNSKLLKAEHYSAKNNKWKSYYYDRPSHFNSLKKVDHKMGLWCYVDGNSELIVTGKIKQSTDIELFNDGNWNMVGFPSFDSETVGQIKSRVGGGSVIAVIEGEDLTQPYNIRVLDDSEVMSHENGYLMKITSPATWDLSNTMPTLQAMPSDISISSETPSEGESITLTAPIFNTGDTAMNDIHVRAYVTSEKEYIENVTILNIPPHSRENITIVWDDIPAGEHTIHVEVDDDNDPSNGYLSGSKKTIKVNHAPKPKLNIYRNLNITLKITGRKDNKVTCVIYDNDLKIKSLNVTRTPGQPNKVTESLKVYEDHNYTMELIYNATHKGANPTWVTFESTTDSFEIKETFKTKDGFDQKISCDVDDDLDSVLSEDWLYHFSAEGSYDPDGEIVSYEWDFGDGESEYGKIVQHEYTCSGIYIVNLMLIDDQQAIAFKNILLFVP